MLSALGTTTARAYYEGSLASTSLVGFVYTENDIVRGFVFGADEPGRLRRDILRSNPWGGSFGLVRSIRKRPSLFVDLLRSFKGPPPGSFDTDTPELTYLAVDESARRAGVGTQLLTAFNRAMRERSVDAYELSVDADNDSAIRFYEGHGFSYVAEYREFGIIHGRYRLELTTPRDAALRL